MISVDEQIAYMEDQVKVEYEMYLEGYSGLKDYNMYVSIVERLKEFKSNAEALQLNQKKCPACGVMFSPMNNLQEHCHPNCRVRAHRTKNRLKDFNKKVNDILKAKEPDAKFIVEQLITSNDKCPFVVTYKGIEYKSDNTRNLLTQLKKI